MSNIKKISIKFAKIGMCMAESVKDAHDKILLKKGMYITSKKQIVEFLDNGIKEIVIDLAKSLIEFTPTKEEEKITKDKVKKEFDNPEEYLEDLKIEIEKAEIFYNSSKRIINEIMHDIRSGKKLKESAVNDSVQQVIKSISKNYQALLSMTSLKTFDEYTYNHSVNVMVITLSIAQHLNYSTEKLLTIGKGALLHDIGKAKIPLDIINKPGKLTDTEYKLIKQHPSFGREICVKDDLQNQIINDIVLHHHEDFEGTGYPHKLKRSEISKHVAIVSISDYYDALTTIRSYKRKINPAEAISMIFGQANKKFDRRLVNLFIKKVGIYPVGSIVKLKSKRIAMVVGFSQNNLLVPIVKILIDSDKKVNKFRETVILDNEEDYILEINPDIHLNLRVKDVI